MKYTDLKNDIKNGAKGIYLFAGDDAYFKMKGEQMLKEAFVQMPELNFSSFAGENLKGANLSSLITAVESYPFMSEKRMVKVTDLYVSDKEYETYLKKTFENFPSASLLLIVNSDSKKSDNLKRKPCITYVDCNRADEETVTKWIYLNLKRRGINAGADVCANIAKYCLCNMSRVALETEKIVDYKVEGTLTQSEADELVYKDAEYRIYEMTNAVAAGNLGKFIEVQSELCKKSGDEIYILSGLFSYFKNLHTVINSDLSDSELAKLLGMKEYGIKKSREQALRIGKYRLDVLVKDLYAALSEIKAGLTVPQTALEKVNNKIFFI